MSNKQKQPPRRQPDYCGNNNLPRSFTIIDGELLIGWYKPGGKPGHVEFLCNLQCRGCQFNKPAKKEA